MGSKLLSFAPLMGTAAGVVHCGQHCAEPHFILNCFKHLDLMKSPEVPDDAQWKLFTVA